MAVPCAPLLSPIHRLIPVIVLSSKVPLRGCVFKESVKIRTSKSPPFSDDFSPDFAPLYVFPHRSCAEAKHCCRFAEREKVVSNWLRRCPFFIRHGLLPYQ